MSKPDSSQAAFKPPVQSGTKNARRVALWGGPLDGSEILLEPGEEEYWAMCRDDDWQARYVLTERLSETGALIAEHQGYIQL